MRKIVTLAAALFLASPASAANFTLYPGFTDPDATIEMLTDKGLVVEIVVRCSRRASGQISPGIMTYSKVERLYCSAKNRCFPNATRAYEDTCF